MDRNGNYHHSSLVIPNDQTVRSGESFHTAQGWQLERTYPYLFGTQTIDWSCSLPYSGRVSYSSNTQIGDTIATNYEQKQLPEFEFFWSMPSSTLSTTVFPTKHLKDEYYGDVDGTVSTPFYSPPPENIMKQPDTQPSSMLPLDYPHSKLPSKNQPNTHHSTDGTLLQPVLHNSASVLDLTLPADQSKPKLFSPCTSKWRCEQCNRHFVSQTGLTHHNKARHAGVRPHRCGKCGKRFSELVLLQRHVLRHVTQNKPHRCDQCPKTFCYRTDLRRHEYFHTGDKPYHCSVCGRGFVRWDHMQRHELTHQKQESQFKELTVEDRFAMQYVDDRSDRSPEQTNN
ncbi:zinc finger protein 135-like [Anopheles moucheti]|uniref:zinc finger protein 135-like n=1 Tax=Anopheles moucheti TaxID=186751 RepID=UPI0022F07844|nr:zinc finger protein 135-like [Anopheles moucheti]